MKIISNGSKWAGEQPDSVEILLDVLKSHKLREHFARIENDAYFKRQVNLPTEFRVSGNFEDISHVFDIRGALEEMRPLMKAFKANIIKHGLIIERRSVHHGRQR